MSLARRLPDLAPLPGPVVTRAALAASERLGLSARVLARVLGLSEPTISRMKRGDHLLDEASKPFELAVLLIRAFRALDAITGGDEAVARAWIGAPNLALGAAPLLLIQTVPGLVDVTAYLDARRAPL